MSSEHQNKRKNCQHSAGVRSNHATNPSNQAGDGVHDQSRADFPDLPRSVQGSSQQDAMGVFGNLLSIVAVKSLVNELNQTYFPPFISTRKLYNNQQ